MNNNKETQILIISLIATLGIVALGIGIFRDKIFSGQNSTNITKPADDNTQIIFTTGEKELIKTTDAKTKGITAFASGNYDEAKNQFEISLKQQKNDPEALIYLNNSRIGKSDSYTIAVIAPVSSTPNEAPEILRGIAQGQNNINNSPQKINGKYLKIMIVDESNNAKKAEKAANELIEKKEVLGVVGHWSSGVTLAAGQVYQSNKLVAISPISTSIKLSGFGNFIFRTTPSDLFAGNALAIHSIKKLNKRKAVIFYDSTSNYSKSLKSVFTTGLYGDGGEVITEFDLHDTKFNAFNSLQKAKQKGAEIIMLIPSSDQPILDQALKVAKANEEKLPILAGDDFYSNEILQSGGRDLRGTVVAIAWHIKAHNNAPFVMESRQLWGGDASWRTVTSYDAIQAFITALKTNPNPNRENVQQALSNSDFTAQGATSEIHFLPSGDRNQKAQLVKVVPVQSSTSGYEFSPIP